MDNIMIYHMIKNIKAQERKETTTISMLQAYIYIYIYMIDYPYTKTGQLRLPPSPSAVSFSTPHFIVEAWVIFDDVSSGTALDAKSSNGACHIPKPTIKTIANISTATIALGSFTLRMSGASSMYIFLIIQA